MKIFLLALLATELIACTKNSTKNEQGSEYPTYDKVTQLVEVSVKSGDDDWRVANDGKRLFLLSNNDYHPWPRSGEYKISGTLQHVMVAESGFFVFNGRGLILSSRNNDSITLACEFLGDSALILSNTAIDPVMHVKFVRRSQ